MPDFWAGFLVALGSVCCLVVVCCVVFPFVMLLTGGEPLYWLSNLLDRPKKDEDQ